MGYVLSFFGYFALKVVFFGSVLFWWGVGFLELVRGCSLGYWFLFVFFLILFLNSKREKCLVCAWLYFGVYSFYRG